MSAVATFKANLVEVDRLVNFDREILQLMTSTVEELHNQLKEEYADERRNGGRALRIFHGIRDNDSVKEKYRAIYNQAVVLLVSHFASALGELFREAVAAQLATTQPGKVLEEEFKLTVAEIKEREWNLKAAVPDLLIAKYDFTFQDMQSTVRAFQTYTGRTPQRDEIMNNIIAAQACRHVIVHSGGRVSDKAVKQVLSASPRTLKTDLVSGEQVAFSVQEIEVIKNDMRTFIERLEAPAPISTR
jgi:hypothetical protein